jgi:hypothetical protein
MGIYQPIQLTPNGTSIDATQNNSLSLTMRGDKSNYYSAQILLNSTSSLIYDTGIVDISSTPLFNGQTLQIPIPANTLTNGFDYRWKVRIYGTTTATYVDTQPEILFKTRSNIVLSIANYTPTINSSTFTFQGNYIQSDGVGIKYFVFNLYDSLSADTPIATSGKQYNSLNLTYTFDRFINQTTDYIELSCESQDSVQATTGRLPISISYAPPQLAFKPTTEILYDKDAVKVDWDGEINIEGKSNLSTLYPADNLYPSETLYPNTGTKLLDYIDYPLALSQQSLTYPTGTSSTNSTPNSFIDGEDIRLVSLKGMTLTNIIREGNFPDTSEWSGSNATISATNNTCTVTASGAINYGYLYQTTNTAVVSGHVVFFKVTFRVRNALCTSMVIQAKGSTGGTTINVVGQTTPVQNQWYTISGLITFDGTHTGNIRIQIIENYANTTNATNAVMEVKSVVAMNLTTLGLANLTAPQVNVLAPSWFDGTATMVNPVLRSQNSGATLTTDLTINHTLRSAPTSATTYVQDEINYNPVSQQYILTKRVSDVGVALSTAETYYASITGSLKSYTGGTILFTNLTIPPLHSLRYTQSNDINATTLQLTAGNTVYYDTRNNEPLSIPDEITILSKVNLPTGFTGNILRLDNTDTSGYYQVSYNGTAFLLNINGVVTTYTQASATGSNVWWNIICLQNSLVLNKITTS